MQRIDALGDGYGERLACLNGAVLDRRLDAELQRLVLEAAETLGLPIALVSLVLKRTQFFRAHSGLPRDLAIARSTDRDVSFCQFVVRDGARFEVTHASRDERVPKDLVEQYGIEAYLGEPVSVGGSVVGSLCVIDTEPRTFSDADRNGLERLAMRVSERLGELSHRARSTSRSLIAHGASPAFSEARNILAALTMGARAAHIAAVDARPLAELVRHLPEATVAQWPAFARLSDAIKAMDTFGELVDEIDDSARRLVSTIEALQGLVGESGNSVRIADIVDTASQLAHHRTKIVGGVSWGPTPPQLRVSTPRMVAVSILSSALSVLGDAMGPSQAGIRGLVSARESEVVIELSADGVDRLLLRDCVRDLSALIDQDPHVTVHLEDRDCIAIRLAAVGASLRPPPRKSTHS